MGTEHPEPAAIRSRYPLLLKDVLDGGTDNIARRRPSEPAAKIRSAAILAWNKFNSHYVLADTLRTSWNSQGCDEFTRICIEYHGGDGYSRGQNGGG